MKYIMKYLIACMCLLFSVNAYSDNNEGYWEWRDRIYKEKNYNDAYFVPKNTITCKRREAFVKIFNFIQDNGGSYNPRKIRDWTQMACNVTRESSIARIIEKGYDERVIKIQRGWRERIGEENKDPVIKQHTREGWTHIGLIQPYDEFMKNRLK